MRRRSLLPLFLGCLVWPRSAPAQENTPAGMPANSWLAVPNTKLEAVAANQTQFPGIQGNGFYTIVDAWNGALLDTKRNRLVIWGGGHNDYYGNEMYVFDISTLAWSRITDPTVNWNNCADPNSDGTASSRHTYNGLSYIAHADRLFVTGGALNCRAGGCGAGLTWTFDFDSKQWRNMQPTGMHTTGCENNSSYDPATKRVYFGDSNGLYAYSYDTNAWAKLNGDSIYGMTSTIDTKRGLLVMAGNRVVWAYDIANNIFTKQVWTTSGGDTFLNDASPGFTYDPVTDRLVGWDGGPVYVLDPTTKVFTSNNPPGAPVRTEQGIFGRFRYVPSVNAFILVTKTNLDVHFYKLSDGSPPVDGGAAGAGGTSADSGAAGAGGAGGSSGGGAATGGSGGTGTGGNATGGTATGGTPAGGTAGTPTGARGGSAGNNAAPGSSDDSSCACRLAPAKGDSAGWLLLLLLGSFARRKITRLREHPAGR